MSELVIYDMEQGTPEWHQARIGIPTASEFATVMAKGRGNAPSETRRKLLMQKAAEILMGEPCPTWGGNAHTERGKEMEGEVRALYEASSPDDVHEVGFGRRGRMGASPDGVVGDDGLLEIKTKLPHLQVEALLAGILPPEHKPQTQGQLLVFDRLWVDFRSYWPGLPVLKVRVYRDEEYITSLQSGIDQFNEELDQLVAKLRGL